MLDVIVRRFEQPDEVREMMKGRFEIVRMNGMSIGPDRRGDWLSSVAMNF